MIVVEGCEFEETNFDLTKNKTEKKKTNPLLST